MNDISRQIGARIRTRRREMGMTLQQLADAIHKSRASVSKYETGDIVLDVQTLYDLSKALDMELSQLADCRPPEPEHAAPALQAQGGSPYFQADRLYFYFYDGRYGRLKDGVIDIHRGRLIDGDCEATLYINTYTPSGRSRGIYYKGTVVYSDMLIRFSFVNQYNRLEEYLLYIFNPLELRSFTEGLLCGISSADLMPCAFKCLVTLTPQEPTEDFRRRLMITRKEMQRWQKLNMWIVDNRD